MSWGKMRIKLCRGNICSWNTCHCGRRINVSKICSCAAEKQNHKDEICICVGFKHSSSHAHMLNSPWRRHLVILFYYAKKDETGVCVCASPVYSDLLYPQGEKFVISCDVPVVSTNWQGNILNKLPAAGIDGMANDLESDMVSLFLPYCFGVCLDKVWS